MTLPLKSSRKNCLISKEQRKVLLAIFLEFVLVKSCLAFARCYCGDRRFDST